ncbi:hypothetical protein [Peribacillus sp. YIM B13477]
MTNILRVLEIKEILDNPNSTTEEKLDVIGEFLPMYFEWKNKKEESE